MKKIFTLLSLLAIGELNAQLLVEDFNFSGTLATNGWTAVSGIGTNSLAAVSTGLTYTGYSQSGIGGAAFVGASGEDCKKDLSAPQTSGTLYLTFMMSIATVATGQESYITGFTSGTGTNYNLRFFVKDAGSGKINFGVSRSSSTPVVYSTTNYDLNTTYLITLKYQWIGTNTSPWDDICAVYVHPTTGPLLMEPATPDAVFNAQTTNGSDATTGINAIFLRQNTATQNLTGTFDGFRVSTTWLESIPVEMTYFKGQNNGNTVKLTWQTASEKNNAFFEVQRSANGTDFSAIGTVKGAGYAQTLNDYLFIDEAPLAGLSYYRLRQVDYDGSNELSKVVSINRGKSGNTTLKVYPTVTKGVMYVEMDALQTESSLVIVDMSGRVVKSQFLTEGSTNQTVDVSELPNGMYFVRLSNQASNNLYKIVKQ